jgi:secernin
MCDTIGIGYKDSIARFAKNSDRSPNEPQVVEFIPAARHSEKNLRATYIEVEQVPETRALLLSRPSWMWGGEMGVNDCGVAIGNEAVFTKGKYGAEALTGMDLLRLALERAENATQALETIISLLERYGQGGNCGFDHNFEYDNAFLIIDKDDLFVLDTVGKQWAYKKLSKASISNCLNLGADADAYSGETYDFTAKHKDPLFTHFSGAAKRRAGTQAKLDSSGDTVGLMKTLRQHNNKVKNPFAQGSVDSVCMHAGGLVGDHTTQSMVIAINSTQAPMVWLTGGSTPCVSLFKPYLFGNKPCAPVFDANDKQAEAYWLEHERFIRKLIGTTVPQEFYAERDAMEESLTGTAAVNIHNDAALAELANFALAQEKLFYDKWEKLIVPGTLGSRRYRNYWAKKNALLGKGR